MLIVQISDFHVTAPGERAYGRINTNRSLARIVKTINGLSPQPDLVIGSGDLVQCGTDEEYGVLRDILRSLRAPFLPLVGNHDRRKAFCREFVEYATLFGPGEFIQYPVDRGDLRLIVLDTLCEGSDDGSYCDERSAWLAEQLDGGRPTVLVMHHPPFRSGIRWLDPIDIGWSDPIKRAIEDAPHVIRILCGHVHREIYGTWHGIPVSTCPSTAHQVALDLSPTAEAELSTEPPGFQLHHWNGSDLITHTASVEGFFKRSALADIEARA